MTHHAPFPCDPQLWLRFLAACQSRDETPGAVLRDLVRLEVQRVERRAARRDDVIDEQLLGRFMHPAAGCRCRPRCGRVACSMAQQVAGCT